MSQFIFSSTAAIFGKPDYVPIDEKHPTAPVNPYGHAQLMVEQMLDDLTPIDCPLCALAGKRKVGISAGASLRLDWCIVDAPAFAFLPFPAIPHELLTLRVTRLIRRILLPRPFQA